MGVMTMSDRLWCPKCQKWVGGGIGCEHYVPAEADQFQDTEDTNE